MMLIEQSVAPLQFVRLEQSHLQAVQDNLILGAGHPKFFAHAPKLEKSEGACPAKRVYAFPLNYLHGVMDWRCFCSMADSRKVGAHRMGESPQNPRHCDLRRCAQQKQSLAGKPFQELSEKPDADRLLRRPARAGQTKLSPQFQWPRDVRVAGSAAG